MLCVWNPIAISFSWPEDGGCSKGKVSGHGVRVTAECECSVFRPWAFMAEQNAVGLAQRIRP